MNEEKQLPAEKNNASSTPFDVSASSENKPQSSDGQTYKVIEGTPFGVAKTKNGTYAITCGRYKMEAEFTDMKQAEAYVRKMKMPWEVIGMFIGATIDLINAQNNRK